MALEVPVVSSNAGGIPEVNEDGVTGYMSEIGDIEAMSRNAIKILSDPETHSLFRANAYKKAQTFNVKSIVPQYEALYDKVLSQPVVI